MFYSIRHITRFQYSAPVSESYMEVRMRPRSESNQRCLKFDLQVTPRSKVGSYRDHMGNTVHYFDLPGHHTKLTLAGMAIVEVDDCAPLPDSFPMSAWEEVDEIYNLAEPWDLQHPSQFSKFTDKLVELARALRIERRAEPRAH